MTRAYITNWTDCSAMFASGLQTPLLQGVQALPLATGRRGSGRSRPRPTVRYSDQHSGRLGHNRFRLAHRNARTRRPRTGASGKSRRPCACGATVGSLDRSRLHPRRPSQRPPGRLHARARRDPIQSRHEGQVQANDQCRQARQGRPHRCHAKADPPRKRPPQGQSRLDAKNRLIKTDTLAQLR